MTSSLRKLPQLSTLAYVNFEKIYSNSTYVEKNLTNDCIVELEEEMEDPDFSLPLMPKFATIEFPKNLFKSPKTTQILDRLNISLNQQRGLVVL
ncbi:hypothetical protein AVEN_250995-1 [Araneus ventricosus]|uniref:Uncharacterized protein n=1 Tax=Araneus ventricosus TaxID=182803 RepID=A0A4Y2P2L1_ARAVE|nr:hypothetical protein AVEN_250995-1 [Araneus ventricosus]